MALAATLLVVAGAWFTADRVAAVQAGRPAAARATERQKKDPRTTGLPAGDLGTIAGWLIGDFSNEAQAPLRGITPGGSDKQPQDQVHAHVRRASVPELGPVVLYVQWNRDRAAGPIARQRLWVLAAEDGGAPSLRIFSFRDPESYVDALESVEILQTLTAEDLIAPAAACALTFSRSGEGFMATTAPACSAPGPGGRPVSLQVRVRVSRDGFTYSEAGFTDPDFTTVFAIPTKGAYEFVRTK